MRLIVLPLSVKRSMVYCQWNSLPAARSKPRIDDRLVKRATVAWNNFASSERKWKQTIVSWANVAMEKIPYDEWSLKTIPAKTAVLRRLKTKDENDGSAPHASRTGVDSNNLSEADLEAIPVLYPSSAMSSSGVLSRLVTLGNSGISHHNKYFWLSAIGAPLTLPVALIPVVPNIPGFYLLYRAWSHWRALDGAKHLKFLTDGNHLNLETIAQLDDMYTRLGQGGGALKEDELGEGEVDRLLLKEENVAELVEIIDAKEMAGELHRAVRQVKRVLSEKKV